MSERLEGVVRWFSSDRGYGFCVVDGDDSMTEYFIHYSAINMDGYKTLKPSQRVSFVLSDTEKGVQATEIELI